MASGFTRPLEVTHHTNKSYKYAAGGKIPDMADIASGFGQPHADGSNDFTDAKDAFEATNSAFDKWDERKARKAKKP